MSGEESWQGSDGVGLCRRCVHAGKMDHPRGGAAYWRCKRAENDTRFRRYPVLPVLRCDGYEKKPVAEEEVT